MREPSGSEPLRVLVAVIGPPLVAELSIAAIGLDGVSEMAVRAAGWLAALLVVFNFVVRPLLAQVAAGRLEAGNARDALDRSHAEMEFRDQVDRALGQAGTDTAAMRSALRAMQEVAPDADVALLLALPDEPRVGWTVRLGDDDLQPARAIPGTPGCAALVGDKMVVTDATSLDSCAHLEDPDMAVSATCIPLHLADRPLGVVSVVQAPGEIPDEDTRALMAWIVERTSTRISEIHRSKRRFERQETDPVTGLPGRDALEANLRGMFRSLVPFCLALVEVDDFTGVEHLRSEDEVEQILRCLADSLRLTVRPDDVVTSLGNGRFAVLLLNCGATHASMAMERVRESMTLSLTMAEVAPFTFSAGVVESHRAGSIDDLINQGRAAVRTAHDNGGSRVALAHD